MRGLDLVGSPSNMVSVLLRHSNIDFSGSLRQSFYESLLPRRVRRRYHSIGDYTGLSNAIDSLQ